MKTSLLQIQKKTYLVLLIRLFEIDKILLSSSNFFTKLYNSSIETNVGKIVKKLISDKCFEDD